MAWAFVRYSFDYAGQEAKAKDERLGMHARGRVPAWEWRAQRLCECRSMRGHMKGVLRALLFGAGLSFALIALVPIVFWLSPEIAPPTDRAWAVGASSAFALLASAMAIWRATRLLRLHHG